MRILGAKAARDIKQGDQLLGSDGRPHTVRQVRTTNTGDVKVTVGRGARRTSATSPPHDGFLTVSNAAD